MANDALSHPLDGCDPDECYRTMMSERTALITARREAEDNLVKTVIQLSAALLALQAGYITQAKFAVSMLTLILFGTALASLAAAIIAGLWEQRFASKAYLEQQKLVEDYFQMKIADFSEPVANKSVRTSQLIAFIAFVGALICLGIFAFVQARGLYVERERSAAVQTGTDAKAGAQAASQAGQLQRRKPIGGAIDAPAAAKDQMKR